jgi:hypothetical protein
MKALAIQQHDYQRHQAREERLVGVMTKRKGEAQLAGVMLAFWQDELSDMREDKRKEELNREIDTIIDDFLSTQPHAYASVAHPIGGREDFYELPKPVVITHRRVGHKMYRTLFVY